LVGSVITHYIGRPQIGLNFRQQRVEADFRHHMVRVREYSEAIALDKGEMVERQQLDTRFASVLRNYLQLIRAQKRLIWFNSFFGQAAVVFPFLVAAPRFFSGAIQLGELVQISSAFDKVQGSLSWFVDNYASLASWRATVNRLTSFEESIANQERLQAAEIAARGAALASASSAPSELRTHNLDLALPDGTPLLQNLALQAQQGDSILIQGPSGSGKSTLFRGLAGIWPFAHGQVSLPPNSMFMPQRPYLPDGLLRDALAYPQPASDYTDAALREALEAALLPQLVNRLDDADAWSQKLSGGEAQRLAVARVLLKKPKWIFADEATSALDEAGERKVYEQLRAQALQAGGALVSIAHRPAVAAYHDKRWTLVPNTATGADGASVARYVLQPG
jgi:putative ATP-binding cassette transporter